MTVLSSVEASAWIASDFIKSHRCASFAPAQDSALISGATSSFRGRDLCANDRFVIINACLRFPAIANCASLSSIKK